MRRLAMLIAVCVAMVCLSGVLYAGAAVYHGVYGAETNCGIGSVPTHDWQAVVTPSGNVKLTCHGEVPNPPEKTVRTSGFPCGVPSPAGPPAGLVTYDSQLIVAPSGQATLVCVLTP